MQKFNLKTDDLKVSAADDTSGYSSIVNTYLSSIKISGKTMTDGKNSGFDRNVSLAGQDIPLEVVSKDTHAYIKLEPLKPILDLYLQTTSAGDASVAVDGAKIKGKYVDANAIYEENASKLVAVASLASEDAKKAMGKAHQPLDKNNFTQDGSAITMTLSGEQLAKFIEKHLSELPEKSRKSYETLLDEKDLAKNIAKLIKVMTVMIDCKKKHQILSSSLLEKKQKTMV